MPKSEYITISINDVVQITDNTHPWYDCLLVVTEIKPWGVQAYATIPESNTVAGSASKAFNRLSFDVIERVGKVKAA